MCTKLISFVCVLALASVSFADVEPIIIGNFENSFDGWQSGGWANIMLGFSSVGGTLDGLNKLPGDPVDPMSLTYLSPPGGWAGALQLKLQGPTNEDLNVFGATGILDVLFPGQSDHAYTGSPYTMVCMDLTLVASEWIDDGDPATDPSVGMMLVLNSVGTNAAGVSSGAWYDAGTLPVGWDPSQGDMTFSVMYDISEGIDQTIDVWNACHTASDQYYELFFITQNSGYIGAIAGMIGYHIDNVRLIPEPATIALLGLGGLSLLRIRRKR